MAGPVQLEGLLTAQLEEPTPVYTLYLKEEEVTDDFFLASENPLDQNYLHSLMREKSGFV